MAKFHVSLMGGRSLNIQAQSMKEDEHYVLFMDSDPVVPYYKVNRAQVVYIRRTTQPDTGKKRKKS